MTTVNGVNNDKTKIPDEFTFRSVLIVCFSADLVCKIDSQSINAHTTVAYMYGNKQLLLGFYAIVVIFGS